LYGDDRIAGLAPLTVERGEGTTRVVLTAEPAPIEVILTEEMSDPLLSQCHARVAGEVRIFRLASIVRL
jgi:hypothetical protein